jgi:hypothetical protein
MKEKKTNCGIYKITNLIPDEKIGVCKVYIGSSENLCKRKHDHFRSLINNKHLNIHLQKAINKYGVENFKFEPLIYIEKIKDKKILKEELLRYEQEYLNDYIVNGKIDHDKCYNLCPIAGSRLGSKQSQQTIEKMQKSNIRKQRIINITENKEFISISEASRFYNISKNNIKACLKGTTSNAGGYKWSYLDEKDLKNSNKYIDRCHKRVINKTTGKEFKSIKEASEFYKVNPISIKQVCKGKQKIAGGYEWSYMDEKDLKDTLPYEDKLRKKVINLDTGLIFNSATEASKFYNINRTGITNVCKGKYNTAGKYRWKYEF